MADLQIVFKGSDEARAAVSSVKEGLGEVGEKADQAKEKGSGFFSGMLQSAGGFLAANVIGSITSQFSSFIGNALGDARQAIQLTAQTENVIKSTGGAAGVSAQHVADFAASLSDAAGQSLFGDDKYQEATNLLLTFKNIKGETLDLATTLTGDLAQALGGDPADQAMMLGKALDNPTKGMTALGKAGLTFTEEQKAQIEAMQAAGDMAGAQAIIIAELNSQVGGSAAAAAAANGGMAQLTGQLGEMGESIGAALLPVINQFVSFALTNLIPALQSAGETLSTLIGTFSTAEGAVGALGLDLDTLTGTWNSMAATVQGAVAALTPIVMGVFGAIQGAITEHGDAIRANLGAAWATAQATVASVLEAIGSVVQTVLGVVTAFVSKHGDDIKAFLGTTWETISQIIKLAMDLIQATIVPIFTSIAGFIGEHSDQITALLEGAWAIIKATIGTVLTVIKGLLTAALQVIKGDWSGAWETVKTMLATVWENIKTIVTAAIGIVKTVLALAWDAIKEKVTTVWDGIKTAVSTAWEGLKTTVSTKVGEVVGLITGMPAKLAGIGEAMVQMVWDGLIKKFDEMIAYARKKLQELADLLPHSEPKDTSSPLYGLGKTGEAIVKMIQGGINKSPSLALNAAPVTSAGVFGRGGGGGAGVSGGGGDGGSARITIDDSGAESWLRKLIRVEADSRLDDRTRGGELRIRTGGR